MEDETIVGRDAELATIDSFVSSLSAGPHGLLLEGAAGAGKTTLWRHAVRSAQSRGVVALVSRPAAAEMKFAYASLTDLVGDVIIEHLDGLARPQSHALEVALLVAEPAGEPPDHRTVATAVLNLIRHAAAARPLLIAVDDVQWLDPSTSRVLEFCLRRLEREPVATAFSWRTPLDGDPAIEPGVLRAIPPGDLERVRVGPLSLGALDRVIRGRLGTGLPRPSLVRVHETSRGNIFFALEIAAELISASRPVLPTDPLPAPADVRALLVARLGRLPRRTRQVLLSLALRGDALRQDAAYELGAHGPAALDSLVKSKLLVVEGEQVVFAHPLIAAAVENAATPGERRAAHARLAAVDGDAERRAVHLALAADGPDPDIADAVEAASRSARNRGAPDAAAALAEHSLSLTPLDRVEDRRRRGLAAAIHHFVAGDTAAAVAMLEAIVATLDPGPGRAEVIAHLAAVEHHRGSDRAAALFEEARDEADNDAGIRGMTELGLAWVDLVGARFAAAEAHAAAATAALDATGGPWLAPALCALGEARFLAHGQIDADLRDRSFALPDISGELGGGSRPAVVWGSIAKWAGDFPAARRWLEDAHRAARERGEEDQLAIVLYHLAELECWAGDYDRSLEYARMLDELSEQLGQNLVRAVALYSLALVRAHQGFLDEAMTFATEGLERAQHGGALVRIVQNLTVLAFVDASRGDHATAVERLTGVLDLAPQIGLGEPSGLRFVPEGIEALIGTGDLARAEARLDWFAGLARKTDRPWALATAARCRGLLLAATGDLPRAADELDRALTAHERIAEPFELARTLLTSGVIRRRDLQRRAAREQIDRSIAIFDRLGAHVWADRGRNELARIGGRTRAPLELTPTERQVADLVVQGHSNSELADRLFMSVKAVEGNLTRIYRKLGVRSRAELISKLTRREDQ